MTNKVAITGSRGFLGLHLARGLISRNFSVLGLSTSFNKTLSEPINSQTSYLNVDYKSVKNIADSLSDSTALVHLAGPAHKKHFNSIDHYNYHLSECIGPLVNTARASLKANIKHFIYISTIGVHGRSSQIPLTEYSPIQPYDSYSIGKYTCELLLPHIFHDSDVKLTILRPPLIYGANCPGNFRSLLSHAQTLPLIPFGSITSLKSFVYVENLVSAICYSIFNQNVFGKTFLISDPKPILFNDLMSTLLVGLDINPSSKLVNIPPSILLMLLSLFRLRSKLSPVFSELVVDPSYFSNLTGWQAPFDSPSALMRTARSFKINPW